ncbi:MAG: PDZ domain-containing protein [Tepidisphaeraceae bacterium]
MKLRAAIPLLTICSIAAAQTTQPTSAPASMLEKVKPSLVVVQYTYDGELGRRDLVAMGVVVREDGLTMVPMDFTPRQLPDEQMKDFKLIIPGDDETEYDAQFLGRDEPYNVSFILPKKPHSFAPVKFVAEPAKVGDQVYSVGLLPKSAGYQPYQYQSHVSAILRGPIPQVLVDGSGLTVTGSVVLNADGAAIGTVPPQNDRVLVVGKDVLPLNDRGLMLDDPHNPNATVENVARVFVPSSDFLAALQSPPKPGEAMKFPFIGVVQLTGLTKDVAEYYGLKGKVAIQVGDVIPGFSADKAGLKKGDIITSLNGKPLERGDLPDEAPMIFTRKLSEMKVGDQVTFGVVREQDQPPKQIKVTLDERPASPNKSKRFYAEDLGFTARDVAFEDTYQRKLPQGTKGVVIAFVRPQSSAQAAQIDTNDFVTQINQTPVTNVDEFKADYQKVRKDKPNEAVVLEVLRGGNTQIIRIEPPRE